MVRISSGLSPGDWWFQIWQPDKIKGVPFEDVNDKELMNDSDYWTLKASDTWHGFDDIRTDNIMLDPIKATVLTPGINLDGSMAEKGIPAGIVSKFLLDHGVVPEKTGFYNLLFLFAPGVTKGKTGTLIAKLYAFKDLYDRNALVTEVFPDLEERYPVRYKDQRIQQLCHEMHTYLKEHNIAKMMIDVYSDIPEQVMVPAEAYEELVRGNIEYVPVRNLKGRIPAVMVVPYPPGIPVIMPGERFTDRVQKTVDYLVMCEEFDNRFPGFETEIHGVIIEDDNGQNIYKISCITNIPKED